MTNDITAIALTYGQASGPILRLDEPISFWGGVDHRGVIVDHTHPQCGQVVSGTVLAMTTSRGSSSGSFCLMELMRTNLAPAAIVLTEADGVTCTGVLVGTETFGIQLPVIQVSDLDLAVLESGQIAIVSSSPDRAQLVIHESLRTYPS